MFLAFKIGFLSICLCIVSVLQAESLRPNFLILLTDDQRPDTLSAYAPDGVIPTPHIDSLADQGVLFHRGYVTTPICAVSRASILTGQYARNHRAHYFNTALSDEVFAQTYPVQLKQQAQYFIGQIGKYGIGSTPAQTSEYDFFNANGGKGGAFKTLDGRKVHDAEWISLIAEQFLDQVPEGQPFCLQLNYKEPHPSSVPAPEDDAFLDEITLQRDPLDSPVYNDRLPSHVKETLGSLDYAGRMKSEVGFQRFGKNYHEKVISVDRSVGVILESLRNRGLLRNTVVIYLSDHGTALGKRQLGGKWTPYEENLRVPYIIFDGRQPEPKRRDSTEIALSIDLAPTVLDLAGLEIPQAYDGMSLVPHLENPDEATRDGFAFEYYCSPLGVRYLARYDGYMGRQYKYVRWDQTSSLPVKSTECELFFDLREDPLETEDLSQSPKHLALLNKFRSALDQWNAVNPNTYRYNTYHGSPQTFSPEIDWELYQQHRPSHYKRIESAIRKLNVSFDEATFDWEVRKKVSELSGVWY